MGPYPTREPDPLWPRHLFLIPAAGFFGYVFTLSMGNTGESTLNNIRIATITGLASILQTCFLSDSEQYRNSLSSFLDRRIVNITFGTCFLMMALFVYCFIESFIVEGEDFAGFAMLYVASMISYLFVNEVIDPGIRFLARF